MERDDTIARPPDKFKLLNVLKTVPKLDIVNLKQRQVNSGSNIKRFIHIKETNVNNS